ncbi:AMP-binding protein [Streptomyces violaceorubidus]
MADPRHADPHRSAHVDTFSRDHLPPPEQCPGFSSTCPSCATRHA